MNKLNPEERFWSKVDRSGDCWEFTGWSRNGYGRFWFDGKDGEAHRYAYELENGPIPDGMQIDHQCHNTMCVRASHLRPVTIKQNGENRATAHRNSTTGIRGVHPARHKPGCFRVEVTHNRQKHFGGEYDSIEDAAEAARQLRLSLYTHNDADRKAA